MSGRGWCIPALLLLAILLLSQPAAAFYNWRGEQAELELRGVTRFYATQQQNPSPNLIYQQENETHWAALARLLVDGRLGSHFTLTGNLLEAAGSVVAESLTPAFDTQRSSALYQSQHDTGNVRAFLVVDSLAGQWTTSHLDLTVGRQPVNLATTFYFAPNDFFAPFAAQEVYRVYKPGVDAARAEIRLGNLSQLTLLGGEPLPGYLGRSYSGIGASYEFTPLVSGQLLLLANLSDHSQLLSGNLVYSLSDESELVATFNLPRGDEPSGLTLNSEYGSLPRSLLIEYRLFF